MSYAAKSRLVKHALPLIVVLAFTGLGYPATRLLFAEAPVPGGVSIATDQPQYTLGQTVGVLITNASNTDVYVLNYCPNEPLAVYRQVRGVWVRIHASTSPTKCVGEPRVYKIPHGQTVPVSYSYWPLLFAQPGRYRIVADIEGTGTGPDVSFTVGE